MDRSYFNAGISFRYLVLVCRFIFTYFDIFCKSLAFSELSLPSYCPFTNYLTSCKILVPPAFLEFAGCLVWFA